MKVSSGGKEIWVHIDAYITYQPTLTIIEEEAMIQRVVANAEALSNDIHSMGHAAVYGIYFYSGQTTIKPESETTLSEIARLLRGDPGLKVNVVGHTDNVGTVDFNMKLSQDRAQSVVQALVTQHHIPSEQLKGYGVGPLAPVVSNDTEEGRAQNRRVELVKR
jgi:outer membrane protein OmpA-like peptidoglycan-associated protein